MEPMQDKINCLIDKIFKEVLHMVASAKGNKAYGALSTPRSKHAIMLSEINNIKGNGNNPSLESLNKSVSDLKVQDNSLKQRLD